ncbi:MAG: hypothetical protein KBT34_03225 [Prevotella sp.]|nr:hypothetical protein [Candidatus Prevotella equi]
MNRSFEQEFMEDIFDVINNNKHFITQEQFEEKWIDYEMEIDISSKVIKVRNPFTGKQYQIEIAETPYED